MTRTAVNAIGATQACELSGVTYRQLDYWARRGWVRPSVDVGLGRAGRRLYGPTDVIRLGALRHFGVAGLDVGKLGPVLAEVDLPLGDDFLVVADADGRVVVVGAEGLRAAVSEPAARVVFDASGLRARLGLDESANGPARPAVREVRSA